MKALFTFIIAVLIFTTASASNFEGIKIATSGKSSIEAKFISKKSIAAVITITNETGKVVTTLNIITVIGNNTIALLDVTTLNEGTYTITLVSDGNTSTTKFVNFKAIDSL